MPPGVDTILLSVAGLQISTYLHVSSAALLLADWFFTLDMEITHAWNGPWYFGRVLFFLTRYSAFVDTTITLYHQVGYSIPVSLCAGLYTIGGWIIVFGIVIAEVILTIRVWALWGRRKDIGILLIIVGIVNASGGCVAYALYGPSYTFTSMDSLSPTIQGVSLVVVVQHCSGASLRSWYIKHDKVIFAMTTIKGVQHYRRGAYGASLIQTFYQDGLTYYAVLIALSVINLVVIFSEFDIAYVNLLTSIQRVFHSILSARMLLHLQQEADLLKSFQNSKSLTTIEIDDLVFQNSSASSLTLDICLTSIPEESPYTRDDGWFGQDGNSSLRQRRNDLEA